MLPSVAALADEAVKAIGQMFGQHPACRAAHARGTLCTGVFTPSEAGRALTRAAHMHEERVPVTVRLSSASGDPGVPDSDSDAHGMAVRFHLPDGGKTDIVAVTLPCFFVRDPETFVALNRLFTPNPGGPPRPRPLPMLAFLARHPESWRAMWASVTGKAPPSFANCRFNALHAFKWIDAQGGQRWVRYSWIPLEGEAGLSREQAKLVERDHLERDLERRLEERRPLRFTLELQIASNGEKRVSDPTAVWSPARTVTAGALEIDELAAGAEPVGYNPMNLIDGIEASEDKILHFRPQAYGISFARRTAA
jgi:catalase